MDYNIIRLQHRSIRLKGYDYSLPGCYFITVCTFNRACIFGDICDIRTYITNNPLNWKEDMENPENWESKQ